MMWDCFVYVHVLCMCMLYGMVCVWEYAWHVIHMSYIMPSITT